MNLTQKSLASELQVSSSYIKQMVACGFVFDGGFTHFNRTTTLEKAVRWITENNFRIVNGKGLVSKSVQQPD